MVLGGVGEWGASAEVEVTDDGPVLGLIAPSLAFADTRVRAFILRKCY